jgi:hypothetical protein
MADRRNAAAAVDNRGMNGGIAEPLGVGWMGTGGDHQHGVEAPHLERAALQRQMQVARDEGVDRDPGE